MAEIIASTEQEETDNPVQATDRVARIVSESDESPAPHETAPAEEEEVPEKFRGKQLKDILRSYEDMEKLVGRQGAELGELRRTHDEVIRSVLQKHASPAAAPPQENPELDDTEFFTNPKEALNKALEQHPLMQRLRQEQAVAKQQAAVDALTKRHSDWQQVLGNPEFQQFVESAPVLKRLMTQAHVNYDVDAADHVIGQFKATRTVAAPAAAPAAEVARRDAVDAGKVPSGSASAAAPDGKKYWKRSFLIEKMQTDPEWYARNADEILQAYREKRVR